MNSIKSVISLAFIFAMVTLLSAPVFAYKNLSIRVTLEPLSSPKGTKGTFIQTHLIQSKIREELERDPRFRLIDAIPKSHAMRKEKVSNGMKKVRNQAKTPEASDGMKKEVSQSKMKPGLRHASQVIIGGDIEFLKMEKPASVLDANPLMDKEHPRDIALNLKLVHPGSDRPFANKRFWTDFESMDSEENPFYIEHSLENIAQSAIAFIKKSTRSTPFEAHVISVDQENRTAMINAGSNDGVEMLDRFQVYSVTSPFMDPLTQSNLGDHIIKEGVLKVKQVGSNLSTAVIQAGSDIKPGHLVRLFPKISIREMNNSKGKPTVSDQVSPWWISYGINTLP